MTEAEIGVMSFEEEEGARSQGIHATNGADKESKQILPSSFQKKQPCCYSDFCPVKLILDY